MPRWVARVLTRIREFAEARNVRFTLKARRELALLDLALDENDACDVLATLTPQDSAGRLMSEVTAEWMYLFKPSVAGTPCYLKVILRRDCIVVSFHEERGRSDGQEDT
jgi:hypothetical protein